MKHPHPHSTFSFDKLSFESEPEGSSLRVEDRIPSEAERHIPCLPAGRAHSKQGFTLLFAALVASLVLSIGIAVFNITLKELKLSSAGRESQFAFYAADTGAECALYWDFQHNAFATTTDTPIRCAGIDIGGPGDPDCCGGQPLGAEYRFRLNFSPEEYCVDVIFKKELIGSPPQLSTTIEAFGRNSCIVGAPRRVERAIRVRY